MTDSELREMLAPRVATRLQAQLPGHGMPTIRCEQLAHDIIAMVQVAIEAERLAELEAAQVRFEADLERTEPRLPLAAVENAVDSPGKSCGAQ